MMSRTYRLNVAREGKWWIVDAPDVDCRTQARTLTEVEEMGRDLIAGALGVDAALVEVDIQIEQPADVAECLSEAMDRDREAQAAVASAARGRRQAARTLREIYGMSAIDAARVLGVSRGRLYQLLDEREKVSA